MLKRKTLISGLTLIFMFFLFNGFSSADELLKVKSSITSSNAKWVAGETSVSRLSPEKRKKLLGLIHPAPTGEDLGGKNNKVTVSQAYALPASLDWRDNGGNYVTPIRDQETCGSCWAFATTGALESATLISQNTPGTDLDLAEQILVSCSGAGDCGGGWIDYASEYIKDIGLPLESCYQYIHINGDCSDACLDWQSSTFKIENWSWVTGNSADLSAIKSALTTSGPLVTTMDVYDDFYYYDGGIYSRTSGSEYQGGHAILLVGYDDPGQYFIVKNSWGTDWGEDGYFRISYTEISSPVYFGCWTIAYSVSTASGNINVTAPNGGETWEAGTTQIIRWTYTETPGTHINIDLLKGGVFNRTIVSYLPIGTEGSGYYYWALPYNLTQGTDYRIRVTSSTNPSITDTSDGEFTVPKSTIALTVPNGEETWQAGTTQTIRWTYTGDPGSSVKIEFLKGESANTITNSALVGNGGSGSYNWAIPSAQAMGNDYRIRVISNKDTSIMDISNGYFTIEGPTISVTAPVEGETWVAGSTARISWTYKGNPGSYVVIELLQGEGNTVVKTITSRARTLTGYFDWRIPSSQTLGTDYRIRVKSRSYSNVFSTSDYFTILGPPPPEITVTKPVEGETWVAGSTARISWTYKGNPGSYVVIELLQGEGNTVVKTITSRARTLTGYFDWRIPSSQTLGTDYRIRVKSRSYSNVFSTSDYFRIGSISASGNYRQQIFFCLNKCTRDNPGRYSA